MLHFGPRGNKIPWRVAIHFDATRILVYWYIEDSFCSNYIYLEIDRSKLNSTGLNILVKDKHKMIHQYFIMTFFFYFKEFTFFNQTSWKKWTYLLQLATISIPSVHFNKKSDCTMVCLKLPLQIQEWIPI